MPNRANVGHLPSQALCNSHLASSVPQVLHSAVDLFDMHRQKQAPVRFVEYWRWRYLDPKTGRTCRTAYQMSAQEAATTLANAEPIPGTMLLREVQDDGFADTGPDVRLTGLAADAQHERGAAEDS